MKIILYRRTPTYWLDNDYTIIKNKYSDGVRKTCILFSKFIYPEW